MMRAITRIPATLIIALVRVYQWTLSPIFGRQCRFQPTCSTYMIQAVEKYGAARGTWMAIRRILRCQPFCEGGHDPVK